MADIISVVQNFVEELKGLPSEGGHETVSSLLLPAVEAEQTLRTLYALEPDLPFLDDNLYLGLIDVFSIPLNARLARPRPFNGILLGYEFHQGAPCLFPPQYMLPLHPPLRRPHGSPALVGSLEDFLANWKIFTHNTLSKISNWNNIVVAGGAVLACLSPLFGCPTSVETNNLFQSNAYSDSDIDIFLWGLTPEQAKEKMEELFSTITHDLVWKATCVRKLNTISIHTKFPTRPIQIILRLYRSPAEILAGFDVDSACCLYNGSTVYINPRGLAACIRQANTVDMTRRSPSYEVRLAKYADRGFEVYLPTLDRTHLNYEHLYDTSLAHFPKGLARLVVLELLRESPSHYPSLYRTRTNPIKSPSADYPSYRPMDFKPVEKRLLKSNYESIWVRIPYRYDWDAERIEQHVKKIDSKLNSNYIMSTQLQTLHRHPAFCGNMSECLENICTSCPIPVTVDEKETFASHSKTFIQGPVQFIQSNPGSQMLSGSFNPLTEDDWSQDAYTDCACETLAIVYAYGESGRLPDTNITVYSDGTRETESESGHQDTFETIEESEASEVSSYHTVDAFGSQLGDLDAVFF